MTTRPSIDRVTIIGLALLLMPILTMLHEIGGHAVACVATGYRVTGLGAFYVDCSAEATASAARRIVALAGPGIDVVLALILYPAWRRARGDLSRLVLWYLWIGCAFAAAGYAAFSGVTGIGDLSPEPDAGIGPLPYAPVWRAVLALGGAYAYCRIIKLGMAGLTEMIGQGMETRPARRTVAHLYYITLSVSAVLASLPNPVGLFITLASATAASFGGNAGLISIGYATRPEGEPRQFVIARNWAILVCGIAMTAAFTLILGPTIRFGP